MLFNRQLLCLSNHIFPFQLPVWIDFNVRLLAGSNPFGLLEVIYSPTNLSPTHIDQNVEEQSPFTPRTMKQQLKYFHVALLTTVALILASLRIPALQL